MKKTVLLAFIISMICILGCACGGGSSNSSASQDSGSTDTKLISNETDLMSCDAGSLKYIGFEKADPLLTEEDNAYVFVFEFTNSKDEPAHVQSAFVIQFFQNGTELSRTGSFSNKAKEQCDLLLATHSEALKDGTVRFGGLALAQDDSPITVIATEQANRDNKKMIEVSLSDGSVKADENNSSTGGSSDDIEELIKGDWVVQDTNSFHFENGDVTWYENGAVQMTGDYTINTNDSTIDLVFHASDGDVKFSIPFKFEDGVLHMYRTKGGDEMVHQ